MTLQKGKTVLFHWHCWVTGEGGEAPREILVAAVQNGSCFSHQNNASPCTSTPPWDALLAKLFTPENHLALHVVSIVCFPTQQ